MAPPTITRQCSDTIIQLRVSSAAVGGGRIAPYGRKEHEAVEGYLTLRGDVR